MPGDHRPCESSKQLKEGRATAPADVHGVNTSVRNTMETSTKITQHTDVHTLSPGTLLSQEELATIFRVQPATVKKWRSTRKGPRSIPIAREPLYQVRDIVAWIDHLRESEELAD